MKAVDALALLVDSAGHAGFLQKEKTEMGDAFPLATITMKDGTRFNVQVWHLQTENKTPAEDDDTTEVVEKTVKLRVRRNKQK